jgi:hypothetical protein
MHEIRNPLDALGNLVYLALSDTAVAFAIFIRVGMERLLWFAYQAGLSPELQQHRSYRANELGP